MDHLIVVDLGIQGYVILLVFSVAGVKKPVTIANTLSF